MFFIMKRFSFLIEGLNESQIGELRIYECRCDGRLKVKANLFIINR
jgi:hypothetical protein